MQRKIDEWGRVLFAGADAVELLFQGHDICKLYFEPSQEIEAYNLACIEHDKLHHLIEPAATPLVTVEQDACNRQNIWLIPVEYQQLDVRAKLLSMCKGQDEIDRVEMEFQMFAARDLIPVLQLMCFLVDRWRERGVVWGVGRGSSVASYCLFLIGVHRINALHYGLDITEFLK